MKENPKKMTVKMVKKDKNEDDFIVFLKVLQYHLDFKKIKR